jgi:hypothetical protein
MDFASDCCSLALKAWLGDRRGAEAMAIDVFVGRLPSELRDRAEQRDSDDLWELAQYVTDQYEKRCTRGRNLKPTEDTTRFSGVEHASVQQRRQAGVPYGGNLICKLAMNKVIWPETAGGRHVIMKIVRRDDAPRTTWGPASDAGR